MKVSNDLVVTLRQAAIEADIVYKAKQSRVHDAVVDYNCQRLEVTIKKLKRIL